MNDKIIIDSVLEKYQYISFPIEYKQVLIEVLKVSKEELKDNLLSITLGGSGGKNNIIPQWSDLDIYIVIKKYDINQIKNIQKRLEKSSIHVGLTIYSLYEIKNDLIDFKTKIMLYEKDNYHVNPTLYGDEHFKKVNYETVYQNDLLNYPHILQMFKRMYIDVLNGNKKIDKNYVKKMLVLIKCILSSYNVFAYGYDEVCQEFMKISNNTLKLSFKDILMDLENNGKYILSISEQIINYTSKYELFKKEKTVKVKKIEVY